MRRQLCAFVLFAPRPILQPAGLSPADCISCCSLRTMRRQSGTEEEEEVEVEVEEEEVQEEEEEEEEEVKEECKFCATGRCSACAAFFSSSHCGSLLTLQCVAGMTRSSPGWKKG